MQQNAFFALEQIIDRQPLAVTRKTSVTKVISLMQEWGNSCTVNETISDTDTNLYNTHNNSCVLVVENSQVQGIFTERDLVKLIAAGTNTESFTIREVMTQDVVSLNINESQDIFSVLTMLRSHGIRHLPVVDNNNNLLGLITAKTLREKLQPINLMRWRKVKEVMETKVINATPNDSVRYIAQLMTANQTSYVAIGESALDPDTNRSFIRPLGIITERDMVQFQNLDLDFEQPAKNLMSTPLFLVHPEDNLWSIHQQMRQRRVRRLLVADARGELLGIVTQTSLLQVFEPTEMYEVIETLQQQVCSLEIEKTQLLESRQTELEQEIKERTADLERSNHQLQLEAKLRRNSRQQFDSILSSLKDIVWSVDPNTFDVLYINPAAKTISGREVAEFYDNPHLWLQIVHPEDRERVSHSTQLLLTDNIKDIEYRIVRPDGEVRWLLDRPRLIRDAEGTPMRLDGIASDITQRKRRESIIKDIASGVSVEIGEKFLSSLVQYLSKILQVDYAFVGKLQSEKNRIKTLAACDRGQILDNIEYDLAGTPCENVVRHEPCIYPEAVQELFPDDLFLQEAGLKSYAGMPIFDSAGKTFGVIAVIDRKPFNDVFLVEEVLKIFDSRVTAELKRQNAESEIHKQAALLDVATDAIMVRGLDDKILFWNKGAENLYGWTKAEALNKIAHQLLYRESSSESSKIQQAVTEQGEWQGELHQVTKTNRDIVIQSRWTLVRDDAGNPESYLVVKTDITEQKQLEAQLLRTQRLESLGTLAGGIAHDLNNLLAPILGFAKLLPLKLPDVDEQTKGFFKIMENNANRGTALVKQILTFSCGLEGEKGIVQVRYLVAEIGQIINETFPKSIELETNAPKNLWTVNADVNQLHQVLMNLAVNARDAMTDGGRLTINVENYIVDEEYARLHLDATEGSYVLITVTDTGEGIPPEVIDRIFEPFFTTKEVGHGTGLGLSTVIGIIKSHDGFVEVISDRAARGTQFKIFLPASDLIVDKIEESTEILHGNGELILVVDDETAILEVTKAILETYNYQVLTAGNGIEAIATYIQNQPKIEAIIMDIMMPSMDGKIAIRTLKKIYPEVKIIAVSGLIERQEIVTELDCDVTAFMNKPYSNEDLLKILREIFGD